MPANLRKNATANLTDKTGNLPVYLGFSAAVIFFVLSGANTIRNVLSLRDGTQKIERTHDIIGSLDSILSSLKDAETGQRGFLITGDQAYLQPYHAARTRIQSDIARARELTKGNVVEENLLTQIDFQVASKLSELEETIRLRREQGFEAARAVVLTDRGRQTMDALRENLAAMGEEETKIKNGLVAKMEEAHRVSIGSGTISAVLGVILSLTVMLLVRRAHALRGHQEWSQNGKLELSAVMAGEKDLGQLSESTLAFLTRFVGAQAGAIFASRKGLFERTALVGSPFDARIPESFRPGEGLLADSIRHKTLREISDIPDGYILVGSGLCNGTPKHLVMLPTLADDSVNAVIELGFINPPGEREKEFLQQVSELMGTAIKSSLYREHLQELLEETQQQAEELMAQSEELRVSNEELEENGRALRESQSRLELQQVEMEQTNLQLESQARALENQKQQLLIGKEKLEDQNRVVEQASRYKSDFLANMSHELRTPLNSTLILSKLLSDNKPGNLTPEQVKFAKTIESAGNDLLSLINDVLDLSKIEAGHMEVHPEPMSIERLLLSLRDSFQPVAGQKNLALSIDAAPGVPPEIHTDTRRLEQVLKNLLSNALKFTEHGSVSLHVSRRTAESVDFAVTDTGIGISTEKQQVIFDPFFQADGTTARKYGGTGLGLSISSNLVRLLGGHISVKSDSGKGSTFTVSLPIAFGESALERLLPEDRSVPLAEENTTKTTGITPAWKIADDRDSLTKDRPVILAIEDDEIFARIIHDLAQELEFQCIVASTAEEALLLARQYLPNAIVLDIGLPDQSGLSVLDRLKANIQTRHIPVHVISASDYSRAAKALGAVGYMLKPVKRDELVAAFRGLEDRFTRKIRRVLIVEDDDTQMNALQQLLGSRDVNTECVRTANECLEKLESETFDCMVLDLSLPDASGFSLLEKLSAEDRYSFPPVIVYTGRHLIPEEEQRLRRYSKSIIIKGAKSHERLLDEVTLFLHQVVSDLPAEKQRMLEKASNRDATLEGRSILIAEDDIRNIFALTSALEAQGMRIQIARNGKEAISALEEAQTDPEKSVDLILMDIMMPEMDGFTAMKEIRNRREWNKIPIIALTAKAMRDDQDRCMDAGANDYLSKPLEVEKLLSLIRVWMPR